MKYFRKLCILNKISNRYYIVLQATPLQRELVQFHKIMQLLFYFIHHQLRYVYFSGRYRADHRSVPFSSLFRN